MIELLTIAFFGLAYAIKGASVFDFTKIRAKSKILERLFDGKVLSTIMVGIFGIVTYEGNDLYPLILMAAWLLAVSPSMGEEHGAIGYFSLRYWRFHDTLLNRIKACFVELDGYKSTYRGRMYDVKKGLQRGVWMGAVMAFATGNLMFIPLSLLFVPAVFIGQGINRLILKRDGWTLAEPIIGAAVFGIGMAI